MNTNRSNQQRPVRRSSRRTETDSVPGEAPRGGKYSRHDNFDASAYGRTPERPQQRGAASAGPVVDERARAYTRRVSQSEYINQRKKAKHKRITLVAVAVVLVLCLGGAGAAFAYYQSVSNNLHAGIDQELLKTLNQADAGQPYEGGPFYMLLLGTDKSSDRAASAEHAGDQFRSDSMMLTRIDPQNKKITLVSTHRDTLVDMGEYGKNKLNAAYALGGASFAVETVSNMAGVPITHYAEINFDGFKDIVDALGGVEVDVPMEIDDVDAGGYLAKGPQTLSGDQALILCRSRHAYDEFGDGDGFRAANQRLVLSAIAKKILQSDVPTMIASVQALSQHVSTDFSITEILSIAQSLRGLDPEKDMYTAMDPTTSVYVDGGWYEYLDTEAWQIMMERVDQGLSPTESDIVDEASGTILATTGSGQAQDKKQIADEVNSRTKKVAVQNGNGVAGASAVAAEQITARGFTVETGNADNFDYAETFVVYNDEKREAEAQEIASAIGVSRVQHNDGSFNFEGDFLVILGADW